MSLSNKFILVVTNENSPMNSEERALTLSNNSIFTDIITYGECLKGGFVSAVIINLDSLSSVTVPDIQQTVN